MSELEKSLDQARQEIATITREEAITWAAKYNLIGEVIYCMDHLEMTPAEALAEWDIILARSTFCGRTLLLTTLGTMIWQFLNHTRLRVAPPTKENSSASYLCLHVAMLDSTKENKLTIILTLACRFNSMPNTIMTTTMSFDQAVQVFNNTLESRKMALKQELMHDPAEYKTWLEAEIARIGQAEIPSDSDIIYVRRYMRHWQACDVLLKERARQEQSRKDTMADLLRTFDGMKQGRLSSLSPFRGDTLFGHTLTKPSQVKGLERVISACKCYENNKKSIGPDCSIIY